MSIKQERESDLIPVFLMYVFFLKGIIPEGCFLQAVLIADADE